jgi:ABC-type sugar transport system substrate-binding protein
LLSLCWLPHPPPTCLFGLRRDAAKPKVGLVMKSLANEFFLTMEDGAKAYQKDHSADFD